MEATTTTTDNELDAAAIESIKTDLLKRKAEVEKELGVVTGDAAFPDYGDKLDENAQEIEEYTTNIATEKVLEDTLRDITSTLDRIAKGSYGTCKYCQKPIGKKRLLARPVASACIECKTKLQNNY